MKETLQCTVEGYNLSWGHCCGRAVSGKRLGQHWFITVYILVFIQGLYTVYNGAGVQGTVALLKLAGNQGRRQPLKYNVRA